MEITVKLGGQLLPEVPRKQQMTIDQPMTIRNLAVLLGLDPEEIGLIVLNRVQSELEDSIPPGSTVSFFPYMSGG